MEFIGVEKINYWRHIVQQITNKKKFLKKLYGKNMFPMDWREITGFVDDWKNFFAQ